MNRFMKLEWKYFFAVTVALLMALAVVSFTFYIISEAKANGEVKTKCRKLKGELFAARYAASRDSKHMKRRINKLTIQNNRYKKIVLELNQALEWKTKNIYRLSIILKKLRLRPTVRSFDLVVKRAVDSERKNRLLTMEIRSEVNYSDRLTDSLHDTFDRLEKAEKSNRYLREVIDLKRREAVAATATARRLRFGDVARYSVVTAAVVAVLLSALR